MPSHNDPLTETGIVADLRKRAFRHGSALAAIQIPQPAKDTFNVTSNGVSPTLQLSALPYNGTLGSAVYLKWNMSPLHEGDDYTVDYSTGIITLASSIVSALKATPTPADRIFVEYWTTGDLIAQTLTPDTGLTANSTNAGTNSTGFALPSTTQAGDLVVVFIATLTSDTITLNGYTNRGSTTFTWPVNGSSYTMYALTKVVSGSSDKPTFVDSNAVWACADFTSASGVSETHVNQVASSTSAATPAVTTGTTTARCWVAWGNTNALTLPARGTLQQKSDNPSIDIGICVDSDKTASTATEDGSVYWTVATVGVT